MSTMDEFYDVVGAAIVAEIKKHPVPPPLYPGAPPNPLWQGATPREVGRAAVEAMKLVDTVPEADRMLPSLAVTELETRERLAEFFGGIRDGDGRVITGIFVEKALRYLEEREQQRKDWIRMWARYGVISRLSTPMAFVRIGPSA